MPSRAGGAGACPTVGTQYQVPASGLLCQAIRVVGIVSSERTYLAAPRRIASRGMPKTTDVASFCAMVQLRRPRRISSSPPAPSSPMPVMMTPARQAARRPGPPIGTAPRRWAGAGRREGRRPARRG